MRGNLCLFFITPIYSFQEGIQAAYGIHAVNIFKPLLYTGHCARSGDMTPKKSILEPRIPSRIRQQTSECTCNIKSSYKGAM